MSSYTFTSKGKHVQLKEVNPKLLKAARHVNQKIITAYLNNKQKKETPTLHTRGGIINLSYAHLSPRVPLSLHQIVYIKGMKIK